MSVRGKLRLVGSGEDALLGLWCPGCKEYHLLNVDSSIRPAWGFNGDYDAPTFNPSVLVTGVRRMTEDEYQRVLAGETIEPTPRRCHSFVTAGSIQFLSDCTHELAGQTIALTEPKEE